MQTMSLDGHRGLSRVDAVKHHLRMRVARLRPASATKYVGAADALIWVAPMGCCFPTVPRQPLYDISNPTTNDDIGEPHAFCTLNTAFVLLYSAASGFTMAIRRPPNNIPTK